MLEAVTTDLVFTISLKRSTQNLQLSTSCRPITPSIGVTADNPTRRLISRDPRIAMQLTTERCLGTAAAKMDRCPPKLESFCQWRCLNPYRIKGRPDHR